MEELLKQSLSKDKWLVHLKNNELGKIISNNTKIFPNLEEAKKYCETSFESLGEPKYYFINHLDKKNNLEWIEFSREYSAADYLGLIERIF